MVKDAVDAVRRCGGVGARGAASGGEQGGSKPAGVHAGVRKVAVEQGDVEEGGDEGRELGGASTQFLEAGFGAVPIEPDVPAVAVVGDVGVLARRYKEPEINNVVC